MQIIEDGKNLFPWQHDCPRGCWGFFFVCFGLVFFLVNGAERWKNLTNKAWKLSCWNLYKYIFLHTISLLFGAWLTLESEMEHSQQLSFPCLNLVMEIHFDVWVTFPPCQQLLSRGCLLLMKPCSTTNLQHKYTVAEHVLCAVAPHVISSAFPQWMHIAYIFRAIKPG